MRVLDRTHTARPVRPVATGVRWPAVLKRGTLAYRYGAAVLASVAVAILALLLRPLVEPVPLLPFLGAVLLAAWLGGLGPGLVATVLCTLEMTYLFMSPLYAFSIGTAVDVVQLAGFAIAAVLISITLR